MSAPMKLHAHVLRGCAPRPLSAYLKALAVLRIVSEQADPVARGYWKDDAFVLVTELDEEALLAFFLNDWRPSPFVSPWNKGSGLLGLDKKGVLPLEQSTAPRFEAVREGIRQAKALTTANERAVTDEKAVKDEANKIKDKAGKDRMRADPVYKQRLARAAKECKRLKDELQPECQRRWRGPALRWLRAAVVITSDGGAVFPALLGTGGNDGKLDFTNNAMQRIGALFRLESEKASRARVQRHPFAPHCLGRPHRVSSAAPSASLVRQPQAAPTRQAAPSATAWPTRGIYRCCWRAHCCSQRAPVEGLEAPRPSGRWLRSRHVRCRPDTAAPHVQTRAHAASSGCRSGVDLGPPPK